MNHSITFSVTFGLLAVLFVLYSLTVDTNISTTSKLKTQYASNDANSLDPMQGTGGRYYGANGYICATDGNGSVSCNPTIDS